MQKLLLTLSTAILLSACGGQNGDVGEINNDWTGNEIKIDALNDEKIDGITCHMAHFDRSVIDRLTKGDWFQNPSNGSISCTVTGPIVIGDIDMDKNGEQVFKQRQSVIFKKLAVRRIYDSENDSMVYLVYSRKIVDGSAKMSIANVGLHGHEVTWSNRE